MINLIWKRVKPWCIPLGLTLLFYILMRHVFLIGYVPTASMEPTLPQESFIFGTRIFDEPQVGDIVVFEKDGALLVKRMMTFCLSSACMEASAQRKTSGAQGF